ncbi:MAG: methylated-DNA--[protein]-cysteine S-methyltransferase [Steroidobacteraceae bacterium]|nr:methylated-DNA--[protein]-cysteine S-methyltransferase [Steroidobacteraceae bacterium]
MRSSHATVFPGATPLEYRRIERSIRFMDERFREQPSLERVAKSAGVAPHHFARMFRRWAGISPKQFMQRLTLQAARESLGQEQSVLQAALDAGLSGPGRLHDLFVTLEAVTPGEYKSRGSGLNVRHGTAATPFGPATIAVTARGIGFVGFEMQGGEVPGWDEYRQSWRDATFVEDASAAAAITARIWGTGTRANEPLRLWVHGSNFQIQVWQALLRDARELTVNYSGIADGIGRPAAARAVGGAVGANPVAWLIPCHHVLRASGALGGYRWGVDRKRTMLAWELSRAISTGH